MEMHRHICSSQEAVLSLGQRAFDRREFLWRFGGGLGGIAMAHLLGAQGLLADTAKLEPRVQRRPASSREGETRRATVHVRRGQPVRHV